jgi:outer membrane protein assembly factor BamA
MAIALLFLSISAALAATGEKDSWGIAPFPIIAYQPETSLILGAGAVFYVRPQNGGTKNDDYKILAYYTLKKQYEVSLDNDNYFNDELFWVKSSVMYSFFPTDYYGIGANTPLSAKENYTPKKIPVSFSFLTRIYGNLYAGPSYDFRYCSITKTEKGKALAAGLTGTGTNISSGAGAEIILDERGGGMNSNRGYYVELKGLQYAHALGSDHRFFIADTDLRAYIPFGKTTLGFQITGTAANGTIPFYYYPSLGGSNIIRGFLDGRYIERECIAAQTEYRFPIEGRWGGTAFVGAGEVAHSPSEFGKHPRAAAGAGVRYMIDTDQKINIRMDVTYNGKDSYVYVNILEAF